MGEMSNEEIIELIDFYKQLGLKQDAYISSGAIIDIFNLLKIKPEIDEEGKRKLTPYEIIGVPPKFDENGCEVPIFIFIKKSGKRGLKRSIFSCEFKYIQKEHEKLNPIIEMYKREYEMAIMQCNLMQADVAFDMLEKLTGGNAKKYINVNYDYLKFYKAMKKQLLIDLFSHFFLMYLSKKKSLIKEGIIKDGKVYKPYKEGTNREIISNFEKSEQNLNKTIEDLRKEKIAVRLVEDSEYDEINSDVNFNKDSIFDLPEIKSEKVTEEKPHILKIKKRKRLKIFNFKPHKEREVDFSEEKSPNIGEKKDINLNSEEIKVSEFIKQR